MGATKTEHFTDYQNHIAVLSKALGHPARIAIIEYLMSVETCICGDIVNELPLAQATVSQHLKELKNADSLKAVLRATLFVTALTKIHCLNFKVISQIFRTA